MRELLIHTPTNVAVNYQLANLGERSIAFVIDLVVVALIGQIFIATIGRLLLTTIGPDGFLELFINIFSQIIILLAYFALLGYYFEGKTLGKRLVGLRTIRIDGLSPTFETFGIRSTMLFLDFLLGFGAVGLLAASSSPLRQRIGDRIAQTAVIRKTSRSLYRLDDILSIKTVDDHEVVYSSANQLGIEQALLLKELIVTWERRPGEQLASLIEDTARRLAKLLGIAQPPPQRLDFIRQVLHDYIVLTR